MKSFNKLLLTIVTCCNCLIAPYTNGQITNGDFTGNIGNDLFAGLSTCPYFSDGSVTNWWRSHGTPNFVNSDDIQLISSDNGKSEGIAGGFEFKKNRVYCITVEIASPTGFQSGDHLFVIAAPSVPKRGTTSACQEAPPTISGTQTIMDLTVGMPNTNQVTFQANADFHDIWIFDNKMSNSVIINVVIKSVDIKPVCGVLTYKDGSVPTGDHVASYISAGSSIPGGGFPVTVDPDNNTSFTSRNSIDITDVFNAQVNDGFVFLALIADYCTCRDDSPPFEDDGDDEGGGGRRAQGPGNGLIYPGILNNYYVNSNFSKTAESLFEADSNGFQPAISLYPNPAKDNAVVQFNFSRACNVQIQLLDATGRVINNICNEILEKGDHKLNINTSQLAAGIYNVNIQVDGITYPKRLTVTR